jgi:hypothetical protein
MSRDLAESREERPDFGPMPGQRVLLHDGRKLDIYEVGGAEGPGRWSAAFEEGGEFHVIEWNDDFQYWGEA